LVAVQREFEAGCAVLGPEVGGQLVDGGVEGGGGGAVAPEGVDSFSEDGAGCEGCCGGVGGEGDYGEGGLGAC
jgi:hypothetical protein